MTLKDELNMVRNGEDTVPITIHITKTSEETIHFFSKQMGYEMDKTLDLLIRYLGLTENCMRVLSDLGYTFDTPKLP